MPIYAYRCGACGHAKDVLQKLSDPTLTTCPACGAETFSKQVTAAGFQLKGSGWYVTDFRNGNATTKPEVKPSTDAETPAKSDAKAPETAAPASAPAASPAPAAGPAAAPPPAPSSDA